MNEILEVVNDIQNATTEQVATEIVIPSYQDYKLRKPQIAILQVLPKRGWLSRREIAKRADMQQNTLCPMLGSKDPDARAKAEIRGKCTSLLTLGYVQIDEVDVDGVIEIVYRITTTGQTALINMLQLAQQSENL